ncbi:hypothetical protein [Haloferula sargassicola]
MRPTHSDSSYDLLQDHHLSKEDKIHQVLAESEAGDIDKAGKLERLVGQFRALANQASGVDLDFKRLEFLNRTVAGLSSDEIRDLADLLKDDFNQDNISLLSRTCLFAYDSLSPPSDAVNSAFLNWIREQENPVFRSSLIYEFATNTQALGTEELAAIFEVFSDSATKDRYAASVATASAAEPFEQIHDAFPFLIKESGEGQQMASAILEINFPIDYDFDSLVHAAGHSTPLLSAVLNKWTSANPEAAAASVIEIDEKVLDPAFEALIHQSPETAGTLVGVLSKRGSSDARTTSLIERIASDDPEALWSVIPSISDPSTQEEIAATVYSHWATKDKEKADEAWTNLFSR